MERLGDRVPHLHRLSTSSTSGGDGTDDDAVRRCPLCGCKITPYVLPEDPDSQLCWGCCELFGPHGKLAQ